MAKRELHAQALEMRKKGMSYSQIKGELGVSKSTLSVWLHAFPLPEDRLRELRDRSEIRIEKYRNARARTRNARRKSVYEGVVHDIGELTDRERFLCGLFLYGGEGSKTQTITVSVSNTDPAVLLFFKDWLHLLGVPKEKIKVRLQLYADMEIQTEIAYWSSVLNLPNTAFANPYIKSSNRMDLTYKQRFTHGTCNLVYNNRDIGEYVHAAMERLRVMFVAPDTQM